MLKQFRDKVALSGITVLLIGVALLIFTFISAYGFLTQSLSILVSQDLTQTFGQALAPLIATCIRIMYLGIMGWVGSLLTIRGITIMAHLPQTTATMQERPAKPQLQPQKTKNNKQPKKLTNLEAESEPEFMVIPPEATAEAAAPATQQSKDESQQTH